MLDWRTHLPTLREWKAEGKIRYIGVTHYHAGAYDDLAAAIDQQISAARQETVLRQETSARQEVVTL